MRFGRKASRHHLISATAVAAALLGCGLPAWASPELRVDGERFKDAAGRVVILRGVNAAGDAKVPPFMPLKDPALFDPLARWGVNVVRLLFTWEAYEPSPGAYDDAYLSYIQGAVRAAWSRGIYAIVDFHQDAFSRYALGGCGDGFPRWALPPTVTPATPDNGPACANWGGRMISDNGLKTAWDAFYADTQGVRTRYLAMVKRVAGALDAERGVIGYDMLNEPGGDEATQLGPLYEDAGAAIREASPTAILFIGPGALVSSGIQTKLDRPKLENAAYAPHYYDPSVLLFGKWLGTAPDKVFAGMAGKAHAWGVPLFLGEFGGPAGALRVGEYLDAMYLGLDEGFLSATQWVYTPGWTAKSKDGWNNEDLSIIDDHGAPRANFRARPFPRRIAGEPRTYRAVAGADPSQSTIELTWEHDPSTGKTELFAPLDDFFGTTEVTLTTTGDALSCAIASPLITCSSDTQGLKGLTVSVKPAAKDPAPSSNCGLFGIEPFLLWPLTRLRRRRPLAGPTRRSRGAGTRRDLGAAERDRVP